MTLGSIHISGESLLEDAAESREQLIRKLADVESQLTARELNIQELSRKLALLESEKLLADGQRPGTESAGVIDGIHRIFQETPGCRTEAQVGRLCLAVAEALTSSRFGLIAEITPEGRIDSIAVSDPGGTLCQVSDPGSRRGGPLGLALHGFYSRILRQGRGFYTNDPADPADRMGQLEGHPPLAAFLGVPLFHAGSPIGILAVADRPGGYRDADLDALEMLAPAVVQALMGKRAETMLHERESFYRQTLESIPGMVFTTLADGCCDYVSRQWTDYTGIPLSEHLGHGWTNFLHPDDRPRVLEARQSAVDGRAAYDLEYRIRRNDGIYEWFRVVGRPILSEKGEVVRWFGVTMNIESRIQSRKALSQSRELFRAIFEQAGIGIARLDLNTRFLEANSLQKEILGYSEEEIRSLYVLELTHPDDLPGYIQKIEHLLAGRMKHFTIDKRERRSDGSYTWVRVTVSLVHNLAGQPRSFISVVQDIAEQKKAYDELIRSREMLQGIFDNIPVMLIMWEPRLWRFTLNRHAETVLGWTADDANEGDFMRKAFPDEAYRAQVVDYMQSLVPGWHEWRVATKEGGSVPGDWANLRLSDNTRILIGVDLRERKQAAQALLKLNETLEQQVTERTALAESRSRQLQALAVELIEAEERERQRIAGLLHEDLQQLLASARFTLQSTCHSAPELEEVQRLLELSIKKSRHLSHELSPAVLHQNELTAALEWLALQMREQFGLDVELDTSTARQVNCATLKVFLFRAVQELLFNIVKHAGVAAARVVLSGADDTLVITVSDAGKGFDPSIIGYVTQKSGLGLLSLRERASYVGGELVIESAPGKGSRLTLTVPTAGAVEPGRPVMSPQDETPVPAGRLAAAGGTEIQVLFADDHKVMRQGLIRLITGKPNISVVGEAANGREAIEMARQLQPDVVVMDVSMPEMDGIEATRRIKTEWPGVRVIGLSMFEDEHTSRAMRDAGAEAFVSKAASSSELLKAIYGMEKADRDE